MISRAELYNDAEEAQRLILDGRQSQMWTALPGIVQDVDLTAMTCSVQPTIQGSVQDENGTIQYVNLPLLVDVPIVFPSAGGFTITFPLAADDEVLVVLASRCIDSWWQSGGIQVPAEERMHDLSDGFAIPGPKSQPNVIGSISGSKLQIRTDDGTTYFQLGSTKMNLVNAVTDLNATLVQFEGALATFMGVLAGFGGGGAGVTQAMLQAPASACNTTLSAVLVKLNALLG